MKKRSLVAALAMLMVSAIVLTSSTYAWFATGTTAQVKGISATVNNTDGSIKISNSNAEGAVWGTSLDFGVFKPTGAADDANATNFTPDTLQPVSFDVAKGTFVAGSIAQMATNTTVAGGDKVETNQMVYTPSEETDGRYVKVNIYIKSETDNDVTATIGGSLGYDFILAALEVGGERTVYSTDGATYIPVKNATQKVIDVYPEDSIVTTSDIKVANDGTYSESDTVGADILGDAVSTNKVSDSVKVDLELTANEAQCVTLYVWAEGNHEDCHGNVSGGFGITVDFAIKN